MKSADISSFKSNLRVAESVSPNSLSPRSDVTQNVEMRDSVSVVMESHGTGDGANGFTDHFVGESEGNSQNERAIGEADVMGLDMSNDPLEFHNDFDYSYKERRKRYSPAVPPPLYNTPLRFQRDVNIPPNVTPLRFPNTPYHPLFFSLPVSLPLQVTSIFGNHPRIEGELDQNIRTPYRGSVPESPDAPQLPELTAADNDDEIVVTSDEEARESDRERGWEGDEMEQERGREVDHEESHEERESHDSRMEKKKCSILFLWRIFQATAILTYSIPSPSLPPSPSPPPLPPPPSPSSPSSWVPWPFNLVFTAEAAPSPSPSLSSSLPSSPSTSSLSSTPTCSAKQWFRHEAVREWEVMKMVGVVMHTCVVNGAERTIFGNSSRIIINLFILLSESFEQEIERNCYL